jgi:hypothetical protein
MVFARFTVGTTYAGGRRGNIPDTRSIPSGARILCAQKYRMQPNSYSFSMIALALLDNRKARRRRLGRCLHLNRALSLGCGQLRFLSSRWHRAGSPIEEEEHSFFAVRKDSLLHQLFNEAHRGSNRPVAYLKCDRLEQKQRRLKARGGDSGYCLKHTL